MLPPLQHNFFADANPKEMAIKDSLASATACDQIGHGMFAFRERPVLTQLLALRSVRHWCEDAGEGRFINIKRRERVNLGGKKASEGRGHGLLIRSAMSSASIVDEKTTVQRRFGGTIIKQTED